MSAPERRRPRACHHHIALVVALQITTLAAASANDSAANAVTNATVVPLEEVRVTGQKLERDAVNTAASTHVVSGRALSDYGDESASDALRRIANATATDDGQFSLRGINSTGVDANQFGRQTASVFLDGVVLDRIALQAGALDAWDVDQLEVLRGAQSTTQGRNALAGGLVLNTRDPDERPDLTVRGLTRAPEVTQFAVAGGGPLGAGVAIRGALDLRDDTGFVTNTTLDDQNWDDERARSARLKLQWRPLFAPDVLFRLGYQRSRRREGGEDNFIADADPEARVARQNTVSEFRFVSDIGSLRADLPLGRYWVLHSTTALLQSRSNGQLDLDYTEDGDAVTRGVDNGRTVTQELRFGLNDWHGLQGVFGLFAARFRNIVNSEVTDSELPLSTVIPVAPGGVVVDFDSVNRQRTDNIAAFGEIDWRPPFAERLVVTAGLRYDNERAVTVAPFAVSRAVLRECVDDLLPALGLPQCLPDINVLPIVRASGLLPEAGEDAASSRYDALLPKLGLRYAVLDRGRLTAFATWNRGYRAGGADVLFSTGEVRSFAPEFTDNYEVGFRSRSPDGQLSADLNLYRIDWRDQQVQVITENGNDSFTANAASSRLYGGEFEGRARLNRSWSLLASVGYSRTRFRNFVNGFDDFSGNRFPRAPTMSGSLGMIFRQRPWFAAISAAHATRYFLRPDNRLDEQGDGRTLVDARMGYETDYLTVTVNARNLLDQFYATDRLRLAPADGRRENGRLFSFGAPRRLGVQVDFRI